MDRLLEVLLVTIPVLGSIAVAFIQFRKRAKSEEKTNALGRELDLQRVALSKFEIFNQFGVFWAEISRLCETTKVDRFLMLRAWNGRLQPLWTTAFYQFRAGEQEPEQYIHTELDKDYVSRLQAMDQAGRIQMVVDDLPESLIKKVYQAEGVKHAIWFFLDRVDDSGGSSAIVYCSFASHENEPFTDAEIMKCSLLVGQIKGFSE